MQSLLFAVDGRDNLAKDIIMWSDKMAHNNFISFGILHNDKFSDGELCPDFTDSVRGKRIYLLSSANTSDEIIRLELAIDAGRRAGAKEIVAVLPYFPYARQDKKDQARGPIGAKVMARKLEMLGATSVITFDLHADQIQGFFEIPVIHVEGKNVYDSYLSTICTENTIFVGPDAGSGKRVKRMQNQMADFHKIRLNYAMMDKTRKKANVIDEMIIIGDVAGKDVIVLDDLVDTAGTLCKASDVLLDAGAKSVRAIITHPVLSGPAYDNIAKSSLTELVVSDSLIIQPNQPKIRVISCASQIAKAMMAINNEQSYEALKN